MCCGQSSRRMGIGIACAHDGGVPIDGPNVDGGWTIVHAVITNPYVGPPTLYVARPIPYVGPHNDDVWLHDAYGEPHTLYVASLNA